MQKVATKKQNDEIKKHLLNSAFAIIFEVIESDFVQYIMHY
jgi:hypothetical protein